MLASDDNNPHFQGARNPDAALHVVFYKKPVKLEFQSELQKKPVFQDVDFVKITTPGNVTNVIDTPARDDHKARFPRQWQAYKSRTDEMGGGVTGTPITEWPRISPAQAEELRALKFYTVESIAHASDAQLQGIGMVAGVPVFVFRDDARKFLTLADAAATKAEADRKLAEAEEQIKAEREALRLEREQNQKAIAEMQEQMRALMAAATGQLADKRGPGRPRKDETA